MQNRRSRAHAVIRFRRSSLAAEATASMTMRLSALSRFLSLTLLVVWISSVASDTHKECLEWAEMGECERNPEYMNKECASACKQHEQVLKEQAKELQRVKSFYDLEAKDIDGKVVKFDKFKDKIVIVTNVASQCGYTESHYRGLVQLHKALEGTPVEILAFPCNQFGRQEPEPCSVIKQFAANKGVEFTMMDKVDVNGPNASLVYKYLKHKAGPASIQWNFATYYVIDQEGSVESFSGVEPMELEDVALGLLNGQEL